jgi:hypothetical protein
MRKAISLLAMMFMTACAPKPPAEVDVLLRPEVQGGKSYTLRVPSNYFIRGANLKEAMTSGTDFLGLWAVYPGFEGFNERTSAALKNEQSPNKAVNFFLRAEVESPEDWATQILDSRLAEAPNSVMRLAALPSSADESVRAYEYVNSKQHWKAYFVKSSEGPVFIECPGTVCKAYRTWRGKLTVRYQFFGSEIPDFAQLDRALGQLIGTFHVTPYDASANP